VLFGLVLWGTWALYGPPAQSARPVDEAASFVRPRNEAGTIASFSFEPGPNSHPKKMNISALRASRFTPNIGTTSKWVRRVGRH